jgi:hypothetical protein
MEWEKWKGKNRASSNGSIWDRKGYLAELKGYLAELKGSTTIHLFSSVDGRKDYVMRA